MDIENAFRQSAIKKVLYYKELGDKTLMILNDADLHFTPNEESNSIAIIIQHIAGNMFSRWTNFLLTDGEKTNRNRDKEFIDQELNKQQLVSIWNAGWQCFISALKSLTGDDLLKTVYIRKEPMLVIDAINRQMAHYPYHVGQIIYLAKIIKNTDWYNLSIPKGQSQEYNDQQLQ